MKYILSISISLMSTFSVAGQHLWGVSSGRRQLALIDAPSYSGSHLATVDIDSSTTGMAYDIHNERLFVLAPADDQLYQVDPVDGSVQEIGPPVFINNSNGLAYDSRRDRLWISNNIDEMFYYDLQSGVAAKMGDITGGPDNGDWEGLGYDPFQDVIYGVNDIDNHIYRIDPITIEAVRIAGPLPDFTWRGLTFDPTSRNIFVTGVTGGTGPALYEVDPVFGTILSTGRVSGVDTAVQGLAAVPAPSSACVVCCVWGFSLRRNRQ